MSNQSQSILQQAKQRMKSGYWLNRSNAEVQPELLDDGIETMYTIVCDILSSDQIVTNPIDRLIDKPYYNGLSPEMKSHYVLETSRKYNELTRRYHNEHGG